MKFYENFRTERPVGTIRLREIGAASGDFHLFRSLPLQEHESNIFENVHAYPDTAVVAASRTGGEGFDIPQSITGPDGIHAQ